MPPEAPKLAIMSHQYSRNQALFASVVPQIGSSGTQNIEGQLSEYVDLPGTHLGYPGEFLG